MATVITSTIVCDQCKGEGKEGVEGITLTIGGFEFDVCETPKHRKLLDQFSELAASYGRSKVPARRPRAASNGSSATGSTEPAELLKCGEPECGAEVKKASKYSHAKTKHDKSVKDITWTPVVAAA